MNKEFEHIHNSIFEKAYDQAISEYGSWEKYKKEQWKSSLYYGKDDLLDLTLCLLGRRVKYPIAALDLAAYTIKKFKLDIALANISVNGMVLNTRTGENDPVQYLSLQVKFGTTSQWRLHYGAYILARCALLGDDPLGYLPELTQNIDPPHDIILFANREFNKIINHQCPYEEEAEKEMARTSKDQINYRNKALKEATDFYYIETTPSNRMEKEIKAEVLIEKEVAKGIRKGDI